MQKPVLAQKILASKRLRAEYIRDAIKWLAWKWDMNRVLAEPTEINNNH